jgi:hypothetical protein
MVVHDRDVRPALQKMLDRGDLERMKEPRIPGSSQFRWIYSRKTARSSEIADLEPILGDQEVA